MKKVRPLERGSRVRVVAPASAFDRDRFERGLRAVESLGLEPEVPDDVYARSDYLAGEDEQRAEAMIAALEDPAVTTIWCARGGFGTSRLLPRLARVRPSGAKLLIGFSDISALHALWFGRYGMCSVHGPVITSLADEPDHSKQHLWRLLSGGARGATLALDPGFDGPAISGTLFATNLSLLAHLIGTPFLPDLSGCILAVEEVGERPYRIDRLWTQLRHANLLAGVAALVLGEFEGCDEPDGSIDADAALRRGLDGVSVPVLRGLAIGHGSPNFALPLGVRTRIDGAVLTIEEEVTRDGVP